MSKHWLSNHDDPPPRSWLHEEEAPKTNDDRRREAAESLAWCLQEKCMAMAEYHRERSQWTDDQWAAHDAEIDEQRKAEEEERIRERRSAHCSRLLRAGWPLRAIQNADTVKADHPAIAFLSAWDSRQTNIVVLSGAAGCGKTTGAAWWAVEKNGGYSTSFVRASEFARSSRFDRETRESWLDAPALVLDDLGAEFMDAKGSFQTDLDELIDVFYGARKALIITTNLTHAQFKARYGERVVDRLRECGKWFSVSSGSMRGKSE